MEDRNIILGNCDQMPMVGLGTWQANDEELEEAVEQALKAGYRHIDTATVYENEKIIGKVLNRWIDSGKVQRSDLFIVTKLPPGGNRPEDVDTWILRSLENLQISYLDLYLIHTPFAYAKSENLHPFDKEGNIMIDPTTNLTAVWAKMEEQVAKGRTKAIGVSNFNIKQISRILECNKVPIACLQVELHVYFQQKELVQFCKKNHIAITAYSPLGSRGLVKAMGVTQQHPDLLDNPIVLELSAKYGKSPAQILLKHTVQKGIAVIPKSTNPRRLAENINIFGWCLENKDVEKLSALDCKERGRICDFSFFKGIKEHPEFPF